MKDLEKELSSLPISSGSSPFYTKPVDFVTGDDEKTEFSVSNFGGLNASKTEKNLTARVLHDYTAKDGTEMTVKAGDMISCTRIESETDWVLGQTQDKKGRLPLAYLELIDQKQSTL